MSATRLISKYMMVKNRVTPAGNPHLLFYSTYSNTVVLGPIVLIITQKCVKINAIWSIRLTS